MFFVPWILVKAWVLPLPDTVQEQVDEAIGHGFDGMIVYMDQAGKPPEYYTGGYFPIQNFPKMLAKRSSEVISPVISPR